MPRRATPTNTTIRTAKQAITTAAALLISGLTVTACSGGDLDGDYFYRGDSNQEYEVATIKGSELTYRYLLCDDEVDEDKTSIGEITEDRTTVNWVTGNSWTGQRDFTSGEATISVGSHIMSKKGTDAADKIHDDYVDACSG